MNEAAIRDKIRTKDWYHVLEVAPGISTPGRYDPRPLLEVMGFPRDLSGKTVLDVGSYDGFFAFEAERRGAERVLASDRHPADHCGFATARELLGSGVEYAMASVYDLSPEVHGTFDVVLFPGVLYHLRHPLLALDRIHAVCEEYAFVETHVLDDDLILGGERHRLAALHPLLASTPLLQFYPGDELGGDASNWIAPNVACLEAMLATSGFRPQLAGRWADRASFIAHRQDFEQPFWY